MGAQGVHLMPDDFDLDRELADLLEDDRELRSFAGTSVPGKYAAASASTR
jgi:hypothetical protein